MSKVVAREPCPKCNSKDNVAVYADGGKYCFTPNCDFAVYTGGGAHAPPNPKYTKGPNMITGKIEVSGTIDGIKDRGISLAATRKFGVMVEYGPSGDIAAHYYPSFNTKTGEKTAVKKRNTRDKTFYWTGVREDCGLFGQNVCRGQGKYITITEGEIDALSVSDMFGNKFDVVSLRDGAGSAERDIKAQLEWLSGYDTIVLCFDNDAAGKEAVDSVKDILPPNKVKIVKLPMKDANEMLMAGKSRDFVAAWWDAKTYCPAGIVKVSETWDRLLTYRDTPSLPYPWAGLNNMLQGMRRKEIVIWSAETGIGKSQTMREIQNHILETTDDEIVGCLMLEESIAKTTLGWMSFAAQRPLHKELKTLSDEELREYWTAVSKDDRLVLLDHAGWQNNLDTLKARIRYMKHVMGCNWIVLDHLSIALSSVKGASGDWAGIDELVTDFVSLVHELDIGLHLVSHTSGDRRLRGSQGIAKLADAVVFLERDKHNEDPEVANTTAVVVDKNRWAGDVGTACYLRYDRFTGRMSEVSAPVEDVDDNSEF